MSAYSDRPKPPRRVSLLETAAYALVVVTAADEFCQSGGFHLWIGIALGVGAVIGACGYLMESLKTPQP